MNDPNAFRLLCERLHAFPSEISRATAGEVPVSSIKSCYYYGVTPLASRASILVFALRRINQRRSEDGWPSVDPAVIAVESIWPALTPHANTESKVA